MYRLSMDQIVITKDYQTVPVPEDLVDAISKTGSYDTNSQVDDFDMIHSIVHDDQSNNNNNNNNNDGHTPFSDEDQYLHETVSTILSLQTSLTVHMKIFCTISKMISPRWHLHSCTCTIVTINASTE